MSAIAWVTAVCAGCAAPSAPAPHGDAVDILGVDFGGEDAIVSADVSAPGAVDAAADASADVGPVPDAAAAADAAVDAGADVEPMPDAVLDAAAAADAVDDGPTPTSSGAFSWSLGADQVVVAWTTAAGDQRTWKLKTSHPLRDGPPTGGVVDVTEAQGAARIRSPHAGFDAVWALAQHERAQASVASLVDGAWNGGAPLACACWQTGEKWTWAWTRDAAYAIALGLAAHDPARSQATLRFLTAAIKPGAQAKLGTPKRILQDTGTGGAWPISTDRLAWALGAAAIASALPKAERAAWYAEAAPIVEATLEDDAELVASGGGLWPGETSFTDWREQTYPPWVASRPTAIARTRALSTNVVALAAMAFRAAAAKAEGVDGPGAAAAALWAGKATAHKEKIAAAFSGAPGIPLPTAAPGVAVVTAPPAWLGGPLDPVASGRADLLAIALAALLDVVPPEKARAWLQAWPMAAAGPPVVWPQSPEAAIYHNRATWPFVTAFAALAARHVGAPTMQGRAVLALVRQAALNLSNMENFAWPGGENWRDEGPQSGPVVNSRRQLWSVAGLLGAVERGVFGVERDPAKGLRVRPRLPRTLVHALWPAGGEVALSGLPVRGATIDVRLQLPAGVGEGDGWLQVASATRNGSPYDVEAWTDEAALPPGTAMGFEVVLQGATTAEVAAAPWVAADAPSSGWLSPPSPTLAPPVVKADGVHLSWTQPPGPVAGFDVLRGDVTIAKGLTGTSYLDVGAPGGSDPTTGLAGCWSVRATSATGLASHHAEPQCHWGDAFERIQQVPAWVFGHIAATSVSWQSAPVPHLAGFGTSWSVDAVYAHVLPARAGAHALEVRYRNERPVQSGYGALPLRVEVHREVDGVLLGAATVALGQTGAGQGFVVSPALLGLQLDPAEAVRVSLLRRPWGAMTALERAALYDGPGGKEAGGAPAVAIDIAGVQLLAQTAAALGPPPAYAFDGVGDFDVLPAKAAMTPGVLLAPWERVSLAWDGRYLYGAVVNHGFEDAARAYLLYFQVVVPKNGALSAAKPSQGMTYLGQVPALPFTPTLALGLRRVTDLGDGFGPWTGLFAPDSTGWGVVRRLQPGAEVFVAADHHTLAFRVPRATLGVGALAKGAVLRVTGHLVHAVAGQEWKGVLPTTATPWATAKSGYLEIGLDGAADVQTYKAF